MDNKKKLIMINLGVDQYRHTPMGEFSDTDRNEALKNHFFELMNGDPNDRQFDPQKYNTHRDEIFEILREIISQTITDGQPIMDAFYNQFVEEDTIDWGDKKEYEINNEAYLTVGKISGNNWDLDRQRMDKGATFSITTDYYYIKVYEYFKRFMTGRMTFEDLLNKVDSSIKKFKTDFVADVFRAGVDGLPAEWYYVGSYNESSIDAVLDNVTASNSGSTIQLVGTKTALNKLQGITVANLSDSQKAEYNTVGYLRNWRGYTCVELPTVFKANSISEFAFDNQTVYALPTGVKPVKILIEGKPLVQESKDIANRKDMTREFCTIFNIGGAFIMNILFGAFKIS